MLRVIVGYLLFDFDFTLDNDDINGAAERCRVDIGGNGVIDRRNESPNVLHGAERPFKDDSVLLVVSPYVCQRLKSKNRRGPQIRLGRGYELFSRCQRETHTPAAINAAAIRSLRRPSRA